MEFGRIMWNDSKEEMNNLMGWFQPIDRIFKIFKSDCLDYHNKKRRRIFVDRDSNVLLVAHLDTVNNNKLKVHSQNNNLIWAEGLDDRLGCWLAHKTAYQLGTDLLLTDREEIAESTGQHHTLKDYCWIAEFDRQGNDVVTYECGSKEFHSALKEFFTVGWGTFSDISMLLTEVACVNVGIGYYYEHTPHCFANLGVAKHQIKLFKQFFHKYKNQNFIRDHITRFPYYAYEGYYNTTSDDSKYNTEEHSKIETCDFCGECVSVSEIVKTSVGGTFVYICEDCYTDPNNKDWVSGRIEEDNAYKWKECPHCGETIEYDRKVCPKCLHLIETY